jgi:hypothetical protein
MVITREALEHELSHSGWLRVRALDRSEVDTGERL